MKKIEVQKIQHEVKVGDICGDLEPTLDEDAIFLESGNPIGFYIRSAPTELRKIADLANRELLSDRVPKSEMRRSSGLLDRAAEVKQFSTIIGACPPKPHMRRPYPAISSVHAVPTAANFLKAMFLLCEKCEDLIQVIAPEIFHQQVNLIRENVPERFRLGRMFSSSISNFNIAAPFHRDAGNIVGCVNVIYTKRWKANGGHTTVPDYGLTVNSDDHSILVYPAWKNLHAVTPIRPFGIGGYRNSLVFYPLAAFKNYF